MSYLKFNKEDLVNLDYSLDREILRSNRAGSYASYSLVGCNTRKYHGLLVCPLNEFDGEQHVLLSSLDLSITYDNAEFNMGIHKYEGDNYNPSGHKYMQLFNAEETPITIYRIGGVRIQRECLLVEGEQQILVKYTVLESDKPLTLRFTPFLAFRNIHHLSKANDYVNRNVTSKKNGVSARLYDGYPELNMQFSKNAQFIHQPDWYFNIEYLNELRRGYEYKEDLFVPGYFTLEANEGDSLYFSAATTEDVPRNFPRKYKKGTKTRTARDTFRNCLSNSAEQFIQSTQGTTLIKSGYHWKGILSRDCFIAAPGLCLANNNQGAFFDLIDTQLQYLKNGLLPTELFTKKVRYDSPDNTLWFIWALQQHYLKYNKAKVLWNRYNKYIKKVLTAFISGKVPHVRVRENGLLETGELGYAHTWMDAIYAARPITPRIGYTVEINALWYNALCFSAELARQNKDTSFTRKWKSQMNKVAGSFTKMFWDEESGYLADYIGQNGKNRSIRPNQIIAASMPCSPLTTEMKKSVLYTIRQHLLTPRGLRTLAPHEAAYKGVYYGSQIERDYAYHQGTAWPWLLQHYCDAHFEVYKESGLEHIQQIVSDFEPTMYEHGLGTISEIYDGSPPHSPRGAISGATSVAALLKIIDLLETSETN